MKFFEIYKILNISEKKKFLIIILFLIFTIFLELVSLGAVIPFVASILDVQSNSVLNNFFDFLNFNDRKMLVLSMSVMLFLLYTFKNVIILLFNIYLHKFISDVKIRLTQTIYKNYLYKNYNFHLNNKSAHLISDLSIEIPTFITSYLAPYLVIFSEGVLAVAIVLAILIFSPNYIILFTLVLICFVILFLKTIKKYLKNLGYRRQIYAKNFLNDLTVSFSNIKESIIYNSRNLFFNSLKKNSENLIDTEFRNMNMLVLPKYLFEIIGILFICFLVVFITKNNFSKEESLIILGLFGAIAIRFIPLVNRLASAFQRIKFGKYAFKKVKSNCDEFKKEDNSFSKKSHDFKVEDFKSINLKAINFEYDKNNKVLHQLNLDINLGEMTGIKGHSGSGKTTLINILVGLIEPTAGKQLLNNQIEYNFSDLYKIGLSYASNNPNLIDLSLKDNIVYGRNYDSQKFIKSLEMSNLLKLNDEMNEKTIGENGSNISEGQKQRIGIARCLYLDPKIIILDEATNALDEQNEREILEKMKNYVINNNKVCVMVSHKSLTMSYCDKIFSLK